MKKRLFMTLFVVAIMVTSLAPLMVATPYTTSSNPDYSISEMISSYKQGDDSKLTSLQSQSMQDKLSEEFSMKTDQVLSSWLKDGTYTDQIQNINGKPSVMLMVAGDDPTLAGEISPLGSFTFGESGLTWVHTAADREQIISLAEHENVLRIEADKKYNQEKLTESKFNTSKTKLQTDADSFTDPFYANDIIGSNYVRENFGYDGDGSIVNVMDSGIDFGHTALAGTLALTNAGESASFGGYGYQLAFSNLYTQQLYLDAGNTSEAEKYAPLHSDANGYIDTSGLGGMKVWQTADLHMGTVDSLEIPLPSSYYVGDIAGNDTGFAFGFAMAFNGGSYVLAPFLLADTTSNGDYDSMYIDYISAREYTKYVQGIYDLGFQVINNAPFNFTVFDAHTDTSKQYLSADFLDNKEDLASDGYNDLSLGALSNTFDSLNLTGRLKVADPIIRGIDSQGIGFSYFGDTGSHGTAVAGEIAAQNVNYEFAVKNSTGHIIDYQQVNITGVAPATDIIGTQFLSDASYIYSNLWVTGYEPNTALEWVYTGDHVANITSNSWGFSGFDFEDDFAYMYDFRTLFLDMLSQPGFVQTDHPGIMVVFSSGNAGPGYGTIASAPMGGTFLMVGATTAFGWVEEPYLGLFGYEWANESQGFDEVVGFSSTGPTSTNYPKVDVVSIGAFDWSISPTSHTGSNTYKATTFSGTSEAAPLTSGALSLIHQAWTATEGTSLAPDMAKVIIKSTAHDLGFDAYQQGSGRIDVKAAVHAIVDGGLPSGDELFFAYSNDSMNNLGSKLNNAFNYWYGHSDNTTISGYTGLDYPTQTMNIKDTSLFGGNIAAGSSTTLNLTVDGLASPTFEELTFETLFNGSVGSTMTQGTVFKYHNLFDLIDESSLSGTDYMQISTSFSEESIEPREQYGFFPYILIISHNDIDGDNVIDDDERSIYNLGFSSYATQSLYLSSQLFNENTYILIFDVLLDAANNAGVDLGLPDLQYDFSFRAFDRVQDSSVSVSGSSSPYTVTMSPSASAMPGYHQGFVKVTGGGGSALVPYTYTVPLQVGEYGADGWAEVSGARNEPLENGLYGAVDYAWRYNTGDWRYYDLELSGTSANSLGIEVKWTHPETMIDIFILDNDGRIIATSDIIYDGAGVFSSTSNNPPTMQRFLLDVSPYRTGDTLSGGDFSAGYDTFTVAMHAVRVDSLADPYDPISLRATWVSNTIDDFSVPQPSLIKTGSDTYNGIDLTTDKIGVEWTEVSTNPIPDFNNNDALVETSVYGTQRVDEESTIPASELVPAGASLYPEWTKDIELTEGSDLIATLDWSNAGSDFDFIVVEKGDAFSFQNDIFEGKLATAGKPETGSTIVPKTATYTLAVEWYAGDSNVAQPFDLDFEVRQVLLDQSSRIFKSLSTSLAQHEVRDDTYVVASTAYGWNFDNEYVKEFIFDVNGPSIEHIPEISEGASGNIVVGTAYDAVGYDFSITHNGETVQTVTDTQGESDVVIDAGLIDEVLVEETFTFSATDDLGQSSTIDFSVFRSDESNPVITSKPNDRITVTQYVEFELDYTISDADNGTYLAIANGREAATGNWTADTPFSIPITVTTDNSYSIRVTFTDGSGNSAFHVVRAAVTPNTPPSTGEDSSEGGGFLSVQLVILVPIIAIPLIRRRFKQ